jgi:hypothetical protein
MQGSYIRAPFGSMGLRLSRKIWGQIFTAVALKFQKQSRSVWQLVRVNYLRAVRAGNRHVPIFFASIDFTDFFPANPLVPRKPIDLL